MRRACRGIRHLLEQHTITARRAKATRAVYVDDEHSEIEVTLEIEDGTLLVIRMTPKVAGPLIVQMSTAYTAIHPPLKSGLGAAGWQGME